MLRLPPAAAGDGGAVTIFKKKEEEERVSTEQSVWQIRNATPPEGAMDLMCSSIIFQRN